MEEARFEISASARTAEIDWKSTAESRKDVRIAVLWASGYSSVRLRAVLCRPHCRNSVGTDEFEISICTGYAVAGKPSELRYLPVNCCREDASSSDHSCMGFYDLCTNFLMLGNSLVDVSFSFSAMI
ncbi:hypothetical protein MLD38_023346 [Melastoma candidum]|uniref:Uncharacterized protein n=1 Tax=Melastoma candidum TaxID=119954 RepID=A0ACB9QLJ1_9MYRT|nr:hypothetical protein MLD38_023346 [Melastoma candidum]